MKCKSCSGEVPPKFSHAISVNMCPLCGETIMDEALQKSLKSLKEAMSSAEEYKNEIFDWLKSNYNLFSQEDVDAKISELNKRPIPRSANQQNHVNLIDSSEVSLDVNGNQIAGPALQDEQETNKFFRHSPVKKIADRTNHFKDMINQIKKNGSPMLMENGSSGVITPDIAENLLDEEELSELNGAFGGPYEEPSESYEDEIPAVVLNMANGKNTQNFNQKDLQRLQNLQSKSSGAKRELSQSGSVGLIRRG